MDANEIIDAEWLKVTVSLDGEVKDGDGNEIDLEATMKRHSK